MASDTLFDADRARSSFSQIIFRMKYKEQNSKKQKSKKEKHARFFASLKNEVKDDLSAE